jgi:hypothetical protein
MQVGGFEVIAVDDHQPTDTGSGEELQHRDAESAGTHHGDSRRAQPRLSGGPHLAQARLP